MRGFTPAVVAFTLVLGLTATRGRATVIISASDVNVAPGAVGTMDFTITSDASDTLASFSLELLITQVGSTASFLQFTTAQPDPYANSNYVFAGQSFGSGGAPLWGPPYQTNYPSDTITGGDFDDSNQGYVTLPATGGGANSYLASVQFQALLGAPTTDQFQISLVNDPNFTNFIDKNGNSLSYSYSSGGGLVTFVASPEPSSWVLAAIGGLGGLLGFWQSRRRRRSPGSSLLLQHK